MQDDEHPIEKDVRQRQEQALEVIGSLKSDLVVLAQELAKRPTDEELRQQLRDNREALEYNRKRGLTTTRIGGGIIFVVLLSLGIPLVINSFANRKNAEAISNCTTPGDEIPTTKNPFNTGHECFDNGQQRTSQILVKAATNEMIIIGCDRDTAGLPRANFEACVLERVTSQLQTKGTGP